MSDELSIQQKAQVSKTPYTLTGGVIGGAAALIGTHYWAKPKYGSHEELVNEASIADEFQKRIDAAQGDEKTLFEDAKSVAEARKNAEAQYDSELKAFIENNTKEHKEVLDPKYQAAIDKAESDLNNARNTFYEQKVAELTKNNAAQTVSEKKRNEILEQMKSLLKSGSNKQADLDRRYGNINQYIKEQTRTSLNNEKNILKLIESARKELNNPELSDAQRLDIDSRIKKLNGDLATARKNSLSEVETILDDLTSLKEKYAAHKDVLNGIKPTPAETATITTAAGHNINIVNGMSNADIKNAQYYLKIEEKQERAQLIERLKGITVTDESGKAVRIFEGFNDKEVVEMAGQIKDTLQESRALNGDINAQIKSQAKEYLNLRKQLSDVDSAVSALRKTDPNNAWLKYHDALKAEVDAIKAKGGELTSAEKSKIAQFENITSTIRNATIQAEEKTLAEQKLVLSKLKFAEDVQRLDNLIQKDGSKTFNAKSKTGNITDVIYSTGHVQKVRLNPAEKAEFEELSQRIRTATDELIAIEKKAGKTDITASKILGEAIAQENVATRIAELEGEKGSIAALEKSIKESKDAVNRLGRLKASLEGIAGKGFKVNATGELYNAQHNKVEIVKGKLTGRIPTPKAELSASQEARFIQLSKQLSAKEMTKEQIEAKAKELLAEAKFDELDAALTNAKSAMAEAKGKLKTMPGMTEEAATEAFNKAKNVAGKEAFVENEVKSKMEEFIEKYSKEFESKLGKNAGWKLAGITAGGALLFGLLGSALAPKKNI